MNRRSFLQSATITGFLRQLSAEGPLLGPTERGKNGQRGGLDAHYDLSLHRVLHGNSPAYTPELLLADIRASGGRRFTNFSGDLSGRYVGAVSTVAQ